MINIAVSYGFSQLCKDLIIEILGCLITERFLEVDGVEKGQIVS